MVRKHPKSDLVWELGRLRLAKLLKHYRKLNRLSREDVQSNLQSYFKKHKMNSAWDQFRSLVDSKINGSISRLESASTDAITIKIPDIQPLVEAYGIPHLIFSSLLSDYEHEHNLYIAHEPIRDFLEISRKVLKHCGEDIKYYIPPTVLHGTDSTHIIYHKLNPNGYSIGHRHPGQELLYVENGTVEVLLHESGIHTELNADDFIYIDANQLHSSRNRSDKQPAEMFIVRFTQLYRESTKILNKEIVINANVLAERVPIFQNIDEPYEVLDRYSLGRFLKLVCFEPLFGKRVTIDVLVERAKELLGNTGHNYSRSKFSRIHKGKADINKEDLLNLAHIYGIDPMLLYNFIFPAFQHAIAIRPKEKNNLKLLPSKIITCKNVEYEVPCRRLANSNTSIAIVTIGPKTETPPNHHPGWELLKPLEGEIAVEFGDAQQDPIRKSWYAHFDSNITHRIRNIGDIPAKAFVVRFFG